MYILIVHGMASLVKRFRPGFTGYRHASQLVRLVRVRRWLATAQVHVLWAAAAARKAGLWRLPDRFRGTQAAE